MSKLAYMSLTTTILLDLGRLFATATSNWSDLSPGPYGVYYQTTWQVDNSELGIAPVLNGCGKLLGEPDLVIELADRQEPRVARKRRRRNLDMNRAGREEIE
jgi:hypothetical protein